MRNAKIRFTAALAVLAGFTSLAAATTTAVRHEWVFGSNANPAPADAGATAAVAPGNFSAGWLQDLSVLPGGAGGYWDLGQNGAITCSFPQGLATTITVEVAQWWDGSIYSDFAAVSLPGARQVSTEANIDNLGVLGGWIVDRTVWEPDQGATVDTLVITAGSSGLVIDSIAVEASAMALPAPQLTINQLSNGQIALSWPAAYSAMVLESTTDLGDPQSWQPVEATVQVGDTSCSVALPADGPLRFYRLKQP